MEAAARPLGVERALAYPDKIQGVSLSNPLWSMRGTLHSYTDAHTIRCLVYVIYSVQFCFLARAFPKGQAERSSRFATILSVSDSATVCSSECVNELFRGTTKGGTDCEHLVV